MKKSDVIEMYKQVKRRRTRTRKTSLFTKSPNAGCKSCGRVTWKPSE